MKVFEVDFRKGSLIDSIESSKATNTGCVFKLDDKGKALQFDGASDRITFSDKSGYNFELSDFSVICWFKTNNTTIDGVGRRLISKGFNNKGFEIYINNVNGYIGATVDETIGDIGNIDVGDNKWHTLIVTFDRSENATCYVDSYLQSTSDISGEVSTSLTNVDDLMIGAFSPAGTSGNYDGFLAKCELHNKLLTTEEIAKDYQNFLSSHSMQKPTHNFVYPKPIDLSKERGIAAAYNMVPQNGEVIDSSGNGNSGTIVGALGTKQGMKFDGTNDYISIDDALNQLSSDTKGTISCWFKPIDATPAGSRLIISFADTDDNSFLSMQITSTGLLRCNTGLGGTKWTLDTDDAAFQDNLWTHIVIVQDGVSPVSYVNGVTVAQSLTETNKDFWFANLPGLDNGKIGSLDYNGGGNILHINGNIDDVRIYSEDLTATEVKQLYNKKVKQLNLLETFENNGADGITIRPIGWSIGTGTFKVDELSSDDSVLNHLKTGTKYLECVSDGTLAIQSDQAYGTWEFDLYKDGGGSTTSVGFIMDTIVDKLTTETGYWLGMTSSEAVFLQKALGGGGTNLFLSSASAVAIQTWYRFKVTRALDGTFTIKAKGGTFGEAYELISANVGSNPVLDTATEISSYLSLDFDQGDRITNIKLTKGIEI